MCTSRVSVWRRLLPSGLTAGLLALLCGGCTHSPPPSAGAARNESVSPAPSPATAHEDGAERPVADTPPAAAPRAEFPFQELPEWEAGDWVILFDGHSLDGWRPTDFAGAGEVEVERGQMILRMGAMLTGVNLVRTNDLATQNYELGLDAQKVEGNDFFCALTFPVGDTCCTFLLGGWGGGVVGISSINGNDASLNETTKYLNFESGRWYRVRVRVTPERLQAWIGTQQMVDVELEGKRISVRPGEIELSQPWGIATWQTNGAIRDVRYRKL